MSNRNNLSQRAEEIAGFIDKNPSDTSRKGRDVTYEPRVLKGNPDAGEWTTAGNAEPTQSEQAVGAKCPNGYDVVTMEVTAYTSGPESTGKSPGNPKYGITKSGAVAGPGTIAAPRSYELGKTRMYVPGYGWGTVQDIGGAIKGNHLDVWFKTVEEAKRWGRRKLNVIVCRG